MPKKLQILSLSITKNVTIKISKISVPASEKKEGIETHPRALDKDKCKNIGIKDAMMDLANELISALKFIAPLYFVNGSLVVWWYLKGFKTTRPINVELFGKHRAWDGFLFLLVLAPAIYVLLGFSAQLGLIMGAGGCVGNLLSSFLKRRLGMQSGSWLPVVDQLDFVLIPFLFFFLVFGELPEHTVLIIFMTLILHPLGNMIAYKLGLKKTWW
ncbi:CDP-archaeol synthase [Candidatus Micrarchaeota archaeon]|nr:CDP-archaeol synthase [Candidatus Micrarchaeota archaeon]